MTNAERALAAEQLQEIRTLSQTMTELAARWAGQAVNNVLEVGSSAIPVGAIGVELSWQVAAGSIEIDNQATHPMTVTSQPLAASAPPSGIGVYQVPAGQKRVINFASRQISVYGTAADVFCYQAFTTGARPVVV